MLTASEADASDDTAEAGYTIIIGCSQNYWTHTSDAASPQACAVFISKRWAHSLFSDRAHHDARRAGQTGSPLPPVLCILGDERHEPRGGAGRFELEFLSCTGLIGLRPSRAL